MFERYDTLAKSSLPVLICGQTGSGKTALAKEIYRRSRRCDRRLIVRGCGTFQPTTFASNMFGHSKGSFTDAKNDKRGLLRDCDGGTLVLDDIDVLGLEQQAALLTFLDDGVVTPVGDDARQIPTDVRLIATTNRDLASEVDRGAFREDLFYRIGEFVLEVPPLAETPTRIEALIADFETEFYDVIDGSDKRRTISLKARSFLQLHAWPGNIRELRSVVRNVHMFCAETGNDEIDLVEMIDILEMPECRRLPTLDAIRARAGKDPEIVRKVLEVTNWNKALAARITALSRPTVYNQIDRHGWQSR